MSIILDKINYCYSEDSAYKVQALTDINLQIHDGENGTDYCIDSTNKELVYSRNRLRNVIFPELKEINNQAVLHINQSAHKLNQVWDFLYDEVKKQYDRPGILKHTFHTPSISSTVF